MSPIISTCISEWKQQKQIARIGRPELTKDDIPAIFYRHYPSYVSGELNVSELARVCDMSRTRVYNQAKQVYKLACKRVSADCSASVSTLLKHITQCRRLNGVAR